MFKNVKELVQLTEERNTSISEIMITQEMEVTGKSREDIFSQMYRNLEVMEQAVENGLKGVKSLSGLTGGDAVKLQAYIASGKTLSGHTILDAVSKAVATNEVNAAMGTICATPTAGLSRCCARNALCGERNIKANKGTNGQIPIYIWCIWFCCRQ